MPESAARRKLAWRMLEARRAWLSHRWFEPDEWDGRDEDEEVS